MFDFILFFLIFLPLMDVARQYRKISKAQRILITGAVTSLCGSYFVYTSILAEKPKNYYELLEIPARGISAGDLKKAFRKASIKYHPDRNPDADTTDLFIEITAANNIIGDESMRFAYDVYAQTNFDQEDSIKKGLKYSKKVTRGAGKTLLAHHQQQAHVLLLPRDLPLLLRLGYGRHPPCQPIIWTALSGMHSGPGRRIRVWSQSLLRRPAPRTPD
mmetsp:Transcript_31276/g.36697  ORF Transcript_31276/g.36697 Transcript_31276/m.36697 type:complete len:217 (-) Transcript_31276:577-1227(-)